ncbi:MAG: S41 family peptidase, partial [Bacteroidota bacterium]
LGMDEVTTVDLLAITRAEMIENIKAIRAEKDTQASSESIDKEENPVYDFQIKEQTAYLQLKSFNRQKLEAQNIKPEKFYGPFIDKMRAAKVKDFVVDLRGNSGGISEMAAKLLPYVIQSNFGEVYLTSRSWKGQTRRYKLPNKRLKNGFTGQLWVLVDGHTFSAGSNMARYLKEYANAIVLGEETATRYEGFIAGSSERVVLPHSNIEVRIWRWHKELSASTKQTTTNRGLIPDHLVVNSIAAVLAERDLIMEKVDQLIKENR